MKYAYLIIANKNHSQLQKLITMLDDSRNDIYLMIDKKSKNFSHNFHVDYSTLNYLKPIDIYWGNYSQIRAELHLFKASSNEHYGYYHLLSGADLPLVNQDEVHKFFDAHPHHEFLAYGNKKNFSQVVSRVKPHLFRRHFRSTSNNLFFNTYRVLERLFMLFVPPSIPLNKIDYASQWVSIDDSLVQSLVNNSDVIYHTYRYGNGVDELFIPIFLNYHPNLKKKVYNLRHSHDNPNVLQGNMRYIDWWTNGGASPYTWKLKDYNKLVYAKKLGHLFSREFNENVDSRIINKIFSDVMNS